MMGAQDQTGTGSGGMSARPDGWSQDTKGGDTRRGPGVWAAVLAFGLLVVMAAGSLKVLRDRGGPAEPGSAVFGPLVQASPDGDSDDSIDAIAVMSGRRFDGREREFRTADVVAIMGHSVLDLRNARVLGEKAVIDAVAIMGHIEIIVPSDWEVTTGDMISAGAVKNLARRTEGESARKVRIDGVVLMGRLDVHR